MILEEIKNSLAEAIGQKYEIAVKDGDFSYPPDQEMGDLSLPCFSLAKELKRSPAEIARELLKHFEDLAFSQGTLISSVVAIGPYLNFKLKPEMLADIVIGRIRKQTAEFGTNNSGRAKRVMVEYSNVNTHKEYHIGHLRNISFGDAVCRILAANGFKPVPVSYINDFGIHTAKTLWAYLEYYKETPLPENRGEFLGQVYVRAASESKDNQLAKGLIEVIMKKIEARQGEEYALWLKTREWSIAQFSKIYQELGVKFEKTYYESEYIDEGRQLVQELIGRGILSKSQGAVIADLEPYNLGVLVVLRSDGTATYPVADLALAKAKSAEYDPEVSIYVVDNRQKLYFRQLFKLLELMGYEQKNIHLEHDYVNLPEGMMSSRSGNTVTYEQLKEDLLKQAKKEIFARHQDWTIDKAQTVAWELSRGAMKFEMLKVGPDQVITFDKNQALSFSGYTAAYLQYAAARINSILRKAGSDADAEGAYNFKAEKEKSLLLKIALFEEAVRQAGEKYDPSLLAKYLFELAQLFNDYYHLVPILKADYSEKIGRLRLISAVRQVLENGLLLLGINTLEEM